MKTNKNKKGFTIVELVIVIAVIAILAGVMIPTFSGVIQKAYLSQDTSLVANINTIITIEKIFSGDPNDAVEIQKLIKSNDLKLETKSKGNYLWYDIENNCVVLAGLNEMGIVLPNDSGVAPAAETEKGKFTEATTPENFVEGYLFITEKSRDNLAEAIYGLRNPDGNTPDAKKESINKSLEKINEHGNVALYNTLNALMDRTAVMTEAGVINKGADNAVTRIIVSAEMKTITKAAIDSLQTRFPNIIVVDFHSEVKTIESDALDVIANSNKIYYVYNHEDIKELYDKNPDLPYLISKDERQQYIQQLNLVYIDGSGTQLDSKPLAEFSNYAFGYEFPHVYFAKTNQAYDFVTYSLHKDGSHPIQEGTAGYTLTADDKYLIDDNGVLNLYAIFNSGSGDFKVGGYLYSSTELTHMLANGGLPAGTTLITTQTQTSKLDASLIGKDTATLTLPAGVTLLVSYDDAATALKEGITSVTEYTPIADMDSFVGVNQLTVAENVELVISSGAYLSVDAIRYAYNTSIQSGLQPGNTSTIVVDGKITSDGNITAYGIIRGDGIIDAKDGTLVEIMTIQDWYGGSNASTSISKKVTPFNNWKMDNIRAKTNIYGKTLYQGKGCLAVGEGADVPFTLAHNEGQTLFLTDNNTIIEKSVTEDGDAHIIIKQGNVMDTAMKMTIRVSLFGSLTMPVDIEFTKMSLPLSHFDVTVASGAHLTLNKNVYKVLPGSDIKVEENGELNINTKVVICNSFDIVFKEKTGSSTQTYTLLDGGKSIQYTRKNYKGEIKEQYIDSIVHTYPIQTPAKFVISGTLNFGSGAAFSGEIIAGSANATINVTADVAAHTIAEGFQMHHNTRWYDTHDPDLYKTPRINGQPVASFTSGTTYTATVVGDGYGWSD